MSAGGGGQVVKASKFGRGGGATQKEVHLNLTPMIDLMTILVVYLVMSFSADPATLANAQGITLSQILITQEKPGEISIISIAPPSADGKSTGALMLDGTPIMPVIVNPKDGNFDFPDSSYSGFELADLKERLGKIAENGKAIEEMSKGARKFKGEVIIHTDRAIPFAVLKPVMRSAGNAGFRTLKIAAKGLN
jgi:biopolymer transport protein ExbD